MKPQTSKFLVLLVAMFAWGAGCSFVLPPFEGYDEGAYYSSIKQVAYDKSVPVYGRSFLDKNIEDYLGPKPYPVGTTDLSSSYRGFFLSGNKVQSFSTMLKDQKDDTFTLGKKANWQSQHPPLYYLSMAVFELLFQHLDVISKVMLLRIISFSFVIAAMFLAGIRYVPEKEKLQLFCVGLGFYPLLFPMFFWEFARVGSDSLCILLFSVCLFLLKKYEEQSARNLWAFALGISLGMGLLTKAFFIPISVAFTIYLLWIKRTKGQSIDSLLISSELRVLPVVIPTLIIGLGWYFYKWIVYGDILGSDDGIKLSAQGGLIEGLRHNFSILALAKGILTFPVSFIYAGSQSMVRVQWGIFLPLLLLGIIAIAGVLWILRFWSSDREKILFYALALTFGAGILYHMFVGLALVGATQTPAYYLHILAPVIIVPLGMFIQKIARIVVLKYIISFVVCYCIAVNSYIVWAQLALFSGCANAPSITDYFHRVYSFPDSHLCLDSIGLVLDRASYISFPSLALSMFALSFLSILAYLKISFSADQKTS